jgi:hypothetical protein
MELCFTHFQDVTNYPSPEYSLWLTGFTVVIGMTSSMRNSSSTANLD